MQYGFFTEKYNDNFSIETLGTGDGKSQFTDMVYDDSTAAIAIGYGIGEGLNTTTKHNKVADESMLIQWQVKFECQESVDAMIKCLLDVKNHLAKTNQHKYL